MDTINSLLSKLNLHEDPAQDPPDHGKAARPIAINQRLVLQLWAASVAKVKHPGLSWEQCLVAGTIVQQTVERHANRTRSLAVTMDQFGAAAGAAGGTPLLQPAGAGPWPDRDASLWVMGVEVAFSRARGGRVLSLDPAVEIAKGADGETCEEATLRGIMREKEYEAIKDSMLNAALLWEDDANGLDRKAYQMYAQFRPEYRRQKDQWKSCELDLDKVDRAVRRGA